MHEPLWLTYNVVNPVIIHFIGERKPWNFRDPFYKEWRANLRKADLIDLRSLQPLDTEAIYTSVKKTGRAIILQEDSLFGGIASDISALITEHCFESLDAPVKRVASMETPIPFISQLENQYLAKGRFSEELKKLLAY